MKKIKENKKKQDKKRTEVEEEQEEQEEAKGLVMNRIYKSNHYRYIP
jgi:hypothetical protein